jgi:hypothetical protein
VDGKAAEDAAVRAFNLTEEQRKAAPGPGAHLKRAAMRVFISWSGDLSKKLAEAFRKWLPSTLQYVKPYFTPADIEKGARWATDISKELKGSTVCIIVLTRENFNSNWIMFEAGAISTTIDDRARICPIVFGIEPTDVQGPLAQFQGTRFTKSDIRQLFQYDQCSCRGKQASRSRH